MPSIEKLSFEFKEEVLIGAPIANVFESTIRQFTEGFTGTDGGSLHIRMEAEPGGRWYRDLGEGRGHLWGFVQSIRKPDLIELSGPMFMSNPVINHIIIRLHEEEGGTRMVFRHRAFGWIEEEHREGIHDGWKEMLGKLQEHAAGK